MADYQKDALWANSFQVHYGGTGNAQ